MVRISVLVIYVWLAAATAAALSDEPSRAAKKTFDVPYRLTDTFHILIRAKINGGGPYNFILDTGAPAMFIAVPIAKEIGLQANAMGWAKMKSLEIEGGASLSNAIARIETPFQLEGINGLGLAGAPIHGMIGYNILARYRIEIDLTRDKLRWTELNYIPDMPIAIGKGGAPGGLDALGAIMKLVGAFLGKKAAPDLAPCGILGIELAEQNGHVVIDRVLAGSPAASTGIEPGDTIISMAGEDVASIAEVAKVARHKAAGDSLSIHVKRHDKRLDFTVKLDAGF